MNHQQDDTDDEENPRDLRSHGRDASRSKNTRNQPNDEKHESVIQHGDTSLSPGNKAERVPFRLVLTDQSFVGNDATNGVADYCKRLAGTRRPINTIPCVFFAPLRLSVEIP